MRRTAMVVAAVLVAAAFPLAAPDGPWHRPGRSAPDPVRIAPAVLAAASAVAAGPGGEGVRSPEAGADATPSAAPAPVLDLVLTLDRPAGPRLRRELDGLGTWSWAFRRVPVAAVRLPADRLGELETLAGLVAVHLNETLPYLLDESARLVDAPRAWDDLGVTGRGVTVAVIDTGVDFTHPDLAPALAANVKLVGFGGPLPGPVEAGPNSDTSTGHGTHVAGDVAGRGTASGGAYRGLAPGAGLVGIGAGDGLTLNLFTVVQAYEWVLEHRERLGIRVVNNSFGSPFSPFDAANPVNVATRAAVDAGLVVVFANGNDGDEMSMNALAAAPWVLGVGAATKTAGIAGFSSAGIEADQPELRFDGGAAEGETRSPLHMGLYHPAFLTPGEAVVSTRAPATITSVIGLPDDARSLPPEHLPRYTTMSGTSMAAPEAAGVVALVLEADPALRPEEVRRVLQTTARPVAGEPFHRQGYGLLDAGAAVALALELRSLPRDEVARRLEERQGARDAEVLASLSRPTLSASWSDTDPDADGRLRHQVAVAPGTARFKAVTNGVSVPFLGLVQHALIVRDAAGAEVGRTTSARASGTTVLDLELFALEPDGAGRPRPYDSLRFGTWTLEIAIGDDLPAQPFTFGEGATVVSTYPPVPAPMCIPTLADGHPVSWLFQDDTATGVGPYAPDPEFTYVGPVRGGTLGNRAPERRLAGTFGGGAGAISGSPVFATAPLAEPLSLGGAAVVQTWLQGPGEAITGILRAELLDLSPDTGATPKVVATSSGEDPGRASLSAPQHSEVPVPIAGIVTIPAGHRLGVRLTMAFAGTAADTLLYDSTRYPSGLTAFAGRPVEDCIDPAGVPTVGLSNRP